MLTVLFTGCTGTMQRPPQAEKGILDLQAWDISHNGPVSLNGEWEFYWQQLLNPSDFDTLHPYAVSDYTHVPGIWNGMEMGGHKITGKGFATYRIRILQPSANAPPLLAFKITDAGTAYRMFANGQLIAEDGVVSADSSNMKPGFHPKTRTFVTQGDTIELIVQVSNNFHYKGGIWSEIVFGTEAQVTQAKDLTNLFDLFFIGATFILFIYHLWIFLFRKSEKTVLWFGILCLTMMTRTLLINERMVYVLFPDLSPVFLFRTEYLTFTFGILPLAMLFYYLFPKDFSWTVLKVFMMVILAEAIIILFTPVRFFSSLSFLFQVLLFFIALYIVAVTVISVRNKRHAAVPFLMSYLIIFVCSMNDILYSQLLINTAYILPYGFFIAILAQAYSLASRISYAFNTMEQLSINLEHQVEERTHQLKEEKKKSDDLLHNILPEEVAEELKQKGIAEAKQYQNVTVLFTDFVNFTGISEQLTPQELVSEIDRCFRGFDDIIEKHGLEKIKTIGDAYMAVSGLPMENNNHAVAAVHAALEICSFMSDNKVSGGRFDIRIGLNSGPVVAGIVGSKKFAYDIWGDTVNTASRMESSSEEGKVNISGATYELVKYDFSCLPRGKIAAKNKGEIEMYFVDKRIR